MSDDKLFPKSINNLMKERFFIPSYQRGYRWTDNEVTALLEDIWDFAINPPNQEEGKKRPFYCLQPVVVKRYNKDEWEVIDGQQRLTTIFLILKNLEFQIDSTNKNIKRIYYETREESENFLNNIDKEELRKAEENIDFHHMAAANKCIREWFTYKANTTEYASAKAKFAQTFLTDTMVIWYIANDGSETVEVDDDYQSYDIFTRLNSGKIPLTNSELIKALFLKRWNAKETADNLRLRQLQIASEWDIMENKLQEDAFWYFIYNRNDGADPRYANRIEYIFDLMQEKPEGAEGKYTFNKFFTEFETSRKINKDNLPDTDHLWLKIKKYFLTIEEWYKNRELYHLTGFLITTGSGNTVLDLIKDKGIYQTKTDFKKYLVKKINEQVKCNIRTLVYNDTIKIKTILLLFNIETLLSNKKSNMRFPFDSYKKENWDIEHVRSQTDKSINGTERRDWAMDIMEYFTGEVDKDKQITYYESLEKRITETNTDEPAIQGIEKQMPANEIKYLTDLHNTLSDLLNIIHAEKINDHKFNELYVKMREFFRENNEPDKCAISNLALLDASTNRSYKNAFFPIKRKIILENDKKGTFIPICTKNIFTKAYSKRFDEIMYWNKDDADNYLTAIEETLHEYLN